MFLTRLLREHSTRRPASRFDPTGLRLPTLCALCRGWGTQRVCSDCWQRFATKVARCTRCAIEVPHGVAICGECLLHPPPFTHSVAALEYAHPWDAMIGRFKFHAALDLAPVLARAMLSAISEAAFTPPSLVLPVPLSRRRLAERGYNQAWELARRIAGSLDLRAEARWLERIKDTPHQLALPPAQREANVHGAFAVEPLVLASLRGRDVAIVDDVMTSGATASELARVLLGAGAASVHVWVLARTPRPDR